MFPAHANAPHIELEPIDDPPAQDTKGVGRGHTERSAEGSLAAEPSSYRLALILNQQ